jgi:hypothetical protein
LMPADGMSAAAKNGTSARPNRQLCYQATSDSLTRERGQCRFMCRFLVGGMTRLTTR